jgi:alkanesulfonate monooxygenase SsuD/methylene tetrahydromethanopterin reductase-like flavin-dependent oxidoreductase (luciferase family)
LISGERVDHSGKYFTVKNVELGFAVPESVPLYLGGRSAFMLRAAGRVADGAIVGGWATPQGYSYAVSCIQGGLDQSRRSLDDFDLISWTTCLLTDSRETELERLKPLAAHIISGAPARDLLAAGLTEEEVESVSNGYRTKGMDRAPEYVPDSCVDAFAIVGAAGYVRERIADLARMSVRQISLLMPYRRPLQEYRMILDRFMSEVVEHTA